MPGGGPIGMPLSRRRRTRHQGKQSPTGEAPPQTDKWIPERDCVLADQGAVGHHEFPKTELERHAPANVLVPTPSTPRSSDSRYSTDLLRLARHKQPFGGTQTNLCSYRAPNWTLKTSTVHAEKEMVRAGGPRTRGDGKRCGPRVDQCQDGLDDLVLVRKQGGGRLSAANPDFHARHWKAVGNHLTTQVSRLFRCRPCRPPRCQSDEERTESMASAFSSWQNPIQAVPLASSRIKQSEHSRPGNAGYRS